MKPALNNLAVCAVAAMAFFSTPVLAADNAAASYGVVDMTVIMKDTEAAKGILSELDSKRQEYQKQITKEEDSLRGVEQEIIKKKDGMTKEEFEKKKREFETKLVQGQKMVMEKKKALDDAFSNSMIKLRDKAKEIIAEIAKEKGFSAVFTQEAVILSRPDLDITGDVVARLNKDVKKISVDWAAGKK